MTKLTLDKLKAMGIDSDIHDITYNEDGSVVVVFKTECAVNQPDNFIISLEKQHD